jgi:hypothetical protein
MEALDGITPPCESGEGCWIPPVSPAGARALEIRDKLVRLHRLEIGPAICNIYNVTVDDLELMAVAEDELNPKEEPPDGTGHNLDTEREG